MTPHADTALADGVLETRDDGRHVLRFERRLAHPIDRVWEALTRPEELIRWWGDADVELTQGGRFTMRWLNTDEEGNRAVMESTIARLEPPRLLELTGGIHGDLRWELRPEGDGTVLSFESTVELPEDIRARVLAGWHYHLDALADALAGRPTELVELEGRWEPIHERYLAKLG